MAGTSVKTNIHSMERLVQTVQELSLTNSLEEITRIVRSVARELTGADGATFVLREGDLCYYADEDAISPLWKGSRFPMETCISGWVMMNKTSAVIEDIYADDRIPSDVYRPTFVKSMAMVPIRTMEPLGAIGNYWASYRKPSDEEVALLQALADVTAVSMENVEVHNKLKEKLDEHTQMLKQIEKQKQQLEEFNQIIAHNMRSPLSNLLMLTNLIENSESKDERMLYIEKLKPVANALNETFEELVNAMHVKTDYSVQRDYCDFEESLKKATDLLQGDIMQTEAEIMRDFSKAPKAYFPKKYLDNIIYNLLSNAIKYRSPERTPKIHINSFKTEQWTYIEIKDNGLGLDLDKYKDKLFKLHKTFHHHPEAKGFGLFITKTQIEAMGGSIDVDSKPDEGTRFAIRLFKNKE